MEHRSPTKSTGTATETCNDGANIMLNNRQLHCLVKISGNGNRWRSGDSEAGDVLQCLQCLQYLQVCRSACNELHDTLVCKKTDGLLHKTTARVLRSPIAQVGIYIWRDWGTASAWPIACSRRTSPRTAALVAGTTNLLSTTVPRRPCALAHQAARRHALFHRRAITDCIHCRLAASMLGFSASRHPLEAGRRHPSRPSL